ncbi:Polyketide cyclase / dehydrase and lipid transport [Geodermatophilus dictyosporus]|uniref:Polyketide cyclase / dehydrase and lipid transport n=1 Tax=Geodermatophilus dictyosporus TaxID=1523247 RepID=A0A1I5R0I4_9ACTN|nr:SRPBCC family protein [Geodermatophilus dictyosporus]SFP52012.1 Polyketide cyclase / dehydrase and lipid transport [Geodermatophilus dictyosporus]
MRSVDASAVFPLSPDETWDLLFGNRLRHIVQFSPTVAAVEDYEMRADGTPRYTMVNKLGPLHKRSTSDYYTFERPTHTANRVLGLPLGGTFHVTFRPVPGGTRVSGHWEVEARSRLGGVLLRTVHPLLTWYLHRELGAWARGVATRDTSA